MHYTMNNYSLNIVCHLRFAVHLISESNMRKCVCVCVYVCVCVHVCVCEYLHEVSQSYI